jgi:hypothetical protein
MLGGVFVAISGLSCGSEYHEAQQDSFYSRRFKRIVKQKTSRAMMPWKCRYSRKRGSQVNQPHKNRPDLTRLGFTLLATAAAANSVDEMMNSPEIKPVRPIIKSIPIKRSL